MTIRTLIPLLLSLLIGACGCNGNSAVKAQLQGTDRADTTINVANAYNNRFLDSATLAAFLANEVPADSIAAGMRRFYASRNYSFAWFDDEGGGLTVQAQGFWNAHKHALPDAKDSAAAARQLHAVVDTLLSNDSTYSLFKDELVNTELRFTKHFFTYVSATYGAQVSPEAVQWHIPRRKLQPQALLDSLLSSKNGEWRPLGKPFQALRNELLKYRRIEQQGSWPSINITKQRLKPGDRSAVLPSVKQRLRLAGVYAQQETRLISIHQRCKRRLSTSKRLLALQPTALSMPRCCGP